MDSSTRNLILTLVVGLAALRAGATTRVVPGDIATIESALALSVSGDSVLVDCGTYFESDLRMPSGVVIRSATGLADCVTIDAQALAGILYCSALGPGSSVEGITFRDGFGRFDGVLGDFGGALRCENSTLELRDCAFVDNDAVYGGGLYSSSADVIMENCSFSLNTATGDGAMTISSSTLTATNCTFTDNWAFEGAGAIWIANASTASITDCEFVTNTTTEEAGAVTCRTGAHLDVSGCEFLGNQSEYSGGALQMFGSGSVSGCTFIDNHSLEGGALHVLDNGVTVENSLILRNVATGRGGGLAFAAAYQGAEISPLVRDCTVVGNSAALPGGGLMARSGVHVVMENTIVAFNDSMGGIYCDGQSDLTISCSDVFDNSGGDWAGCTGPSPGVAGNISLDPQFCDRLAGDLRLAASSPCLPGGNTCAVQMGARAEGCPGIPVAVEVPRRSRLGFSRPNPFNPRTSIPYEVGFPGQVELSVFDARGRRVRTLVNRNQSAGEYVSVWDGNDDRGRSLGAGSYLIRLKTKDGVETSKVLLLP
jgi:hypothetical protein